MENKINILIGSNIKYAPYYGVMLTSLFMNNSGCCFDIFLLTDNTWPEKETQKFEKLTKKYNSRFFVYIVDEKVFRKFPLAGHVDKPTYYKFIASQVLPDDIHKILYMDGDIIVNGDIRPLWNTNLTGKAFAGVYDQAFVISQYYERIGYDKEFGYYNFGLILFDFDYMRKNNISELAIKYVNDNPERVLWMDQDVLNPLLCGKGLKLPLMWNFQIQYTFNDFWRLYDDTIKNDIIDQYCKAVIIHYNGQVKPWSYKYHGCPFYKEWLYYMHKSMWHVNIYGSLKRFIIYTIQKLIMPTKIVRLRNLQINETFWN